jgi:hypothetical protein
LHRPAWGSGEVGHDGRQAGATGQTRQSDQTGQTEQENGQPTTKVRRLAHRFHC